MPDPTGTVLVDDMRFREQLLWDRMKSNVRRRIRLERIENGLSAGMPDVLSVCLGVVTWCELKSVAEAPKRKGTPLLGKQHGLTIDQLNWHLSWQQSGGNCCVIIGVGQQTFLVAHTWIETVNTLTYEDIKRVAIVTDWPGVSDCLEFGLQPIAINENNGT